MKTEKAGLDKIASFKGIVRLWASKIGAQPKRIQIQYMTKKWASCSTSGRICFSADLLKEDTAFQEIVIVHEILHLHVPNHGKLFKSLLNAYLPRWETIVNGRGGGLCRKCVITRHNKSNR